MDFTTARTFFESWGLYPSDEDCGDLDPAVAKQGISRPCWNKLLNEARASYGDKFARFCDTVVDANNDEFYLEPKTWPVLEALFVTAGLNDAARPAIARNDVIEFCRAWNLDINLEDGRDNELPGPLFDRMLDDAERVGGESFLLFIQTVTDSSPDGAIVFLSAKSWEQLGDRWAAWCAKAA